MSEKNIDEENLLLKILDDNTYAKYLQKSLMRLKMLHPTFLQTSFLPFSQKGIKYFILKAGPEAGKAFASLLYLLNAIFQKTETIPKEKNVFFVVLCPYKARAD